jgi:flagellar biosynthesis protein FlhF
MEGSIVKLKTYQAYTMAEALAAVKRDLGQSAVILHTRTFKRGGFLGLGRKTVVEVTATTAEDARDPAASTRPAPVSASTIGARRAYGTSAPPAMQDQSAAAAKPQADEPMAVTEEDRRRTRRLAQMLALQHEKRRECGDQQMPQPSADDRIESHNERIADSFSQPARPVDTKVNGSAANGPSLPSARRFILTPEPNEHDGETGDDAEIKSHSNLRVQRDDHPSGYPVRDAAHSPNESPPAGRQPVELFADDAPVRSNRSDDARAMQEELTAIREMVGKVLQRQARVGGGISTQPTMPQQLFEMYLKLIGQDVSEELADRIINDVRDELAGDNLHDEDKLRDAMLRHLTDYIPTAQHAVPQHSPDNRPLTIALVGPTGVGKTTTLAKLAASFKLRHNRKVGLITSDTYRIAAVDQLRTYANIIGLPLQVALTPREMEQCVHALSDCDVILIDTAGRGQNDSDRLKELRQFIAAADPHEVHLVLSGTASEKVLLREAEAFSDVGVDKIVLTKLDEAVSFGMLVNVIRQVGKELSFFTTGQEVPDHIEIGRPERLAELILGGKVHA